MTGPVIDLWLARPGAQDPGKLQHLLSHAEASRAARFRFAEDRAAFSLVHAIRRAEIGRRLGIEPGTIRFGRTEKGRPSLQEPSAAGLGFTASRRRGLVAFALGPAALLGVDVENVAPVDDPDALLSRFLDPASIAGLGGLPSAALQLAFARLWTITEAVAKARGTGLETFVPRLSVRFEGEDQALVEDGPNRWRCILFAPDPAHSVALASALPVAVKLRDWKLP